MSEFLKVLDEMTALRAMVARIEEKLSGQAGRSARGPVTEDATAPLTACELAERWGISGQPYQLSRKCRRWGLKPLAGGRGWSALYARADVLRAEAFAAGQLTKRKGARA